MRQRGKRRGALAGFGERLDRGSFLRGLCTSQRQFQLLQSIAARASRDSPRTRARGVDARRTGKLAPASVFAGRARVAKIRVAAALGCELELDVFRIDTRQIVSKYLGETEKNLGRLFDAAEETGALLFFDEADALLGKRSKVKDSHDRYANVEIDYLLARIEKFDGLVILAVNNVKRLSEPLLRRIASIVEFPIERRPLGAVASRRRSET